MKTIDDTYSSDSGVTILNLSTNRKVLSLLRSITGLHFGEAWGLETGETPKRFYIFHPFNTIL